MGNENELAIIENTTTAIQQGGLGIDFGSKLFSLKPATVSIVQKNTTIDGAVPGKLRITNTGDQFDELFCTLLVMPTEQRQYHIGQPGELNRTLENLMCFSHDMVSPDPKAKVPQSMTCANCTKASWNAWREHKDKTGFADKSLIPACDCSYYVLLLDTIYRLPMQMYIRSKAREPFEHGMQNLARLIAMGKAQGRNPNLFDVKFRLSTKQIQTGKFYSYVPVFADFAYITKEERSAFGEIYLQYINRNKVKDGEQEAAEAEAEAESQVTSAQTEIDTAVVDGEYVSETINEQGDIVI